MHAWSDVLQSLKATINNNIGVEEILRTPQNSANQKKTDLVLKRWLDTAGVSLFKLRGAGIFLKRLKHLQPPWARDAFGMD